MKTIKMRVFRVQTVDLGLSGEVRCPMFVAYASNEEVAEDIALHYMEGKDPYNVGYKTEVIGESLEYSVCDSVEDFINGTQASLVESALEGMTPEQVKALKSHFTKKKKKVR